MSIDIDGNDYWVWDAISVTSPKVVIIETHIEFGFNNIDVYPGRHPDYHGASPVAVKKLARRKGYRLVGANRLGFNTTYVRDGLAPFTSTQQGARCLIRANQGLEIRARLTHYLRQVLRWRPDATTRHSFAGIAGGATRARAKRREADWRRQLARAFIYQWGRSPDQAEELLAEYGAREREGPDLTRIRPQSVIAELRW
jgi:hypothetical protein